MSFFYGDTKTDELVVGQTSSSNGYIDLYDSGTTNKITLRAPNSITSSYNLTLPSAIGIEDQVLVIADGVGNISFSDQVKSAKRIVFTVKNNSAATLIAGTPVYIDGITAGSSGRLTVRPTNSNSSATMPAAGLIEGSITAGSNGVLVEQGEIFNVDTSIYDTNDTLFVDSTTGNLTINKPGYPNLIQNIGRVGRVDDTEGFIIVTGPSRTNDVPNLGDSNIWIGKGSGFNTVECPITGDVSLSNLGVVTVNGISNTATITSAANITMDDEKLLIFRNANTSIQSSSDSNLSIKVDNTIFNHTGDVNYLTISSNADSSCVAVSFIGKSYNSNSTTPGVDEGKTGGSLDILAASGSSNISGQYGYGSGGAININKYGYGLGGNNFNNNAAGYGSTIYLNGGQGGYSYLNTSLDAGTNSNSVGGNGGSISLTAGTGGTGYDGGDGGHLYLTGGYSGSGSNSSGNSGNIYLNSNITTYNPNINFDSNISLIGTKKLFINSNSYINSQSSTLYIKNEEDWGSINLSSNGSCISIGSSGINLEANTNVNYLKSYWYSNIRVDSSVKLLGSNNLYFNNSNIFSSTSGILELQGPTSIVLNATTASATNNFNVTGNLNVGNYLLPTTADGASLGSATKEWSDLYLADSSVINMGNAQDVTLTHLSGSGILLNNTNKLGFGAIATYINSSTTSQLDLVAPIEVKLTTATANVSNNLKVGDTLRIAENGTGLRMTNVGAFDNDSGDFRIFATSNLKLCANGDTNVGLSIDSSAYNVAIHNDLIPNTADGSSIGSATNEWSDLYLADGAVINLGNDQDVTLTHIADTGVRINDDKKLQLRDNTANVYSSVAGQLDLQATNEIKLTSTRSNINGETVYGVNTFTAGGATDGTRVEIKSSTNYNSVKSIIQSTSSDNSIHYFNANSGGQTGEMMHILYYNANVSGSANIDFNTTNLYSGTGANRYLEFDTPGQSATLIWIDNASATIAGWRIINTGGAVRGT